MCMSHPENGVALGTAFEDLPDTWICPECGVGPTISAQLRTKDQIAKGSRTRDLIVYSICL